jgi:hypothetical protein
MYISKYCNNCQLVWSICKSLITTAMKLSALFLLLFPFLIFAQSESIFNGIALDESLETVTQKLNSISGTSNLISIDNVSFPLAENKEDHLVCTKVKTENGTLDSVVFTFADDKLKYIEARGNTVKTFTSKRKDTARTYMDYSVYLKVGLFVDKKKDVARILTQEATHTNLFTWENPYLNLDYKRDSKTKHTNKIPEFLAMGESLDSLKPILDANSKFTTKEELDGSDPNAQLQINCFGVNYLGFPRKVEARFGDKKLNVVWILTAKGEEDRIRTALIKQFGEAIFINEEWEVFNNWQVGLRKDKPEVLLMRQEIGLEYKSSYFKH